MVFLVVFDEQDVEVGDCVAARHLRLPFGSSTISSQYWVRTFIASTRPANVTGFVMNELTPRSYVRKMSSSAFDVVSTMTGIFRRSGLALISASASRPSFFGMFRSRRISPGSGEAAGSA